ncbi:MAG: DUF1592 domain-containing protein [Polyangiaceae bacterium]
MTRFRTRRARSERAGIRATTWWPLLGSVALAACIGDIGDPHGPAGGPPVEQPPETQGWKEPTLRRLTRSEFAHSVIDLLGPVTLGEVEADSIQEGFFAVGASQVALSPAGVTKYEQVLDVATAEAFADATRAAEVLACVPVGADDAACIDKALSRFGRRAWRRPLTDAELTRYRVLTAEMTEDTGDVVQGVRHAAWAMLQSPYFLYRVELGAPAEDESGRLKYSVWELASRLSFTLWNSVPDDELLDAAEAGELDDAAGVSAQAARMLADGRARQGVETFAVELYELWRMKQTFKDAELFPAWTPSLAESMRTDLLRRIEDAVFDEPADFLSLYDGRKAFVNNELAAIYGLPELETDAWRAVELPEGEMRRGLVGSGAVLAMNSLPGRTSATERGKFIADAMLCKTVPPPPPTVDTNLNPPEGSGPMTLRQKLEPHRADPACAACHGIMDPLGLALENFDSLGRFRETDQGLPIDATGELDGVAFADGRELATALREHPQAASCLVRKVYTFAAGRAPVALEDPLLEALGAELDAANNRFDALLLGLVQSDDFRYAQPLASVAAAGE